MHKYLFSIIFCLIIFAIPSASQVITWAQTNNSLSGNVNDLAHQNGIIYAGTVAGVHKTADLGGTWQLMTQGLTNTRVFALTIKNDNELYCGTQGGIFYSADQGASWTAKNTGLRDKFITTLNYKGGDTIYAGTLYTGMFMSSNGGNSWDSVAGEFSNKAVNAIGIRHTGEIYVGTTSGLYRSDIKGKNFITMTNNLPEKQNVYAISIRSNGIVYFGTRDGQIWRTTNNGNSWTKQLDLKANIQIYNILLAKNGAVLATSYGNGVYRSNDNGDSWQQINNGLSNKYAMSLAQHKDGNYFVATWGNGVFRGFEPPINTIASGTYCAGSFISVEYKIVNGFTFNAGNEFIVQLSDSGGSFTKAVEIGRIQSTVEGTIVCKIPDNTKSGSGYKVRVTGTSPSQIGSSSDDIIINALPGTRIVGKIKVCINSIEQYSVNSEANARSEWYVTGGTIKSPATTDTIDVEWHYAEDAMVMLVRNNFITGCRDTSFINIQFWPQPEKPTITRMGDLLVSSSNTGNQWYRNGVLLDGETDKVLDLKGVAGLYTVQATDQNGCISSISDIFDYNVNSVGNDNFYYGVNVYPSPTSGLINAEININMPANVSVEIYNLNGEKIESRDLGLLDSKSINKIELIDYPEGTFYMKFNVGKEVIFRRIIIIK